VKKGLSFCRWIYPTVIELRKRIGL